MAITTGQITCSVTPVQIDGTSYNPFKLFLHNASASDSIYIGADETVSATTGFDLHSKSTLTLELPALSTLWVMSANGSPTINWMKVD